MAMNREGASPWRAAVDSMKLFLGSRRRRECRTLVLTALLLLSSCLNDGGVMARTANSAYDLHISDQSRHDLPGKGTGDGILLFAYGTEKNTTERYLAEAFVAARRIKALNPTANITLVTNPDLHPTVDGAFDLVINIEPEYMVEGRVQSWNPSTGPRQWLTRIEYLGRSPYEVTVALDAGVLCCSSRVDEILKQGLREFDIAFAVQGPRVLAPHNWAIMYRLNDNTIRLFNRWRILQIALSKTGSDQGTLHMAAGSLALRDKLNVGVISETVALSLISYSRTALTWPKTSQLMAPGSVLFVHFTARSHEEETTACDRLNEDTSRARVLFQRAPMPRSKETKLITHNTWEMKYSEAELAEAAKNAHPEGYFYFKDLDWDNSGGKWSYAVTPWKELYPQCWDHLYEEVKQGMQKLLKEKPGVESSPAFETEFADDHIWSN